MPTAEPYRTPEELARLVNELRRQTAVGVDQADRGELAPLDAQATLARVRKKRTESRKEK